MVTQLLESRERRVKRGHLEEIETFVFAQPHVVEAIVNHISGHKAGVAGTYNRATYQAERREAVEKWGRYLTGLVSAPLSEARSLNPAEFEEIGGQLARGTRLS